jgi:hypothetical protein
VYLPAPRSRRAATLSEVGTLAVELSNDHEAVRLARRAVADHLQALGLDDLVDGVKLVVTELVTNAFLHAGCSPRLVLAPLPRGVRVEVHDSSRLAPVLLSIEAGGMTGRGLRLVDALATTWGFSPTDDGKKVWAELLAEGGATAEELTAEEVLAAWVEDDAASVAPRYQVVLGDVPTDLLLSAKAHVDNLVRDRKSVV